MITTRGINKGIKAEKPSEVIAPINVKPEGGRGEVGHEVGMLNFSLKKKISNPRDKIVGQNLHLGASEAGEMSFKL